MRDWLQGATTNWMTSTAGVAAALLIIANAYKPGMDWKQWAIAAGEAVALALLGGSASDHHFKRNKDVGVQQAQKKN